ncbi:hypothetical protein PM082_005192 [Marasmius tenuissimus]|nr:hypothetical protein PM082_005192 [Marasmius tenuissimus]
MASSRKFVTLGMFIIDQFEFLDDNGNETGRPSKSEIGGGGTYAAIGARICPNAEEALSLLSIPLPPTKAAIEKAADKFLELGAKEAVVIRSGGLGAYVLTRARPGEWITAFWGAEDMKEVVDVTGAGNSFLGGLAAGLDIAEGDIYEASLYAAVSASFTIQQGGLPVFSEGLWNQDSPTRRLEVLKKLRAVV